MNNKFSLRITIIIVVVISCSFLQCNKTHAVGAEVPEIQGAQIPDVFAEEFFVEQGSDLDSSYISFRGIRKNNDTLEIQATSWEVIEYGMFLSRKNSNRTLTFTTMGTCGTVFQRTWSKMTLSEWISRAETDTLQELVFTNYRNSITIVQTAISH